VRPFSKIFEFTFHPDLLLAWHLILLPLLITTLALSSLSLSCIPPSIYPTQLDIRSSFFFCFNMYLTRSSGTRYSMPTSAMKSQQRSSASTHPDLGPLNTTSFLFDDNDDQRMSAGSQGALTSPNATSFLQMTPNDDNFPTLRSDGNSGIVSFSSSSHLNLG
jgi:hypothetical protein